jgi:hypothetical protein
MITIRGFTPTQRDLADQLWSMDTEQQARAFVASLPEDLQREAWVVISMIMAHELDTVDQVTEEVQAYLRSL